MALVSRATRNTFKIHESTPSAVGPGSYAGSGFSKNRSTFGKQKPSYAGFSTSQSRDLIAKTTSAETPGPGAYLGSGVGEEGMTMAVGNRNGGRVSVSGASVTTKTRPQPTNSFATKIPRMAPSEPGSTVFCKASSASNPGPGTYGTASSIRIKSGRDGKWEDLGGSLSTFGNSKELLSKPGFNPPTIPVKFQAFGYEEEDTGELRRLPPPGDVYSGRGGDTVGPAFYNTASGVEAVKTRVSSQVNFHRSGTERKLWEATNVMGNSQPDATIPGPGTYNHKSSLRVDQKPSGPDDAVNKSSFFASKVKNCSEYTAKKPETGEVGPGSYLGLGGNPQGGSETMGGGRSGAENFGSTAARKGWQRQADQPYSDPSFKFNPGPGSYSRVRSDFDFVRPKRLTEDVVGFSSSNTRPCLTIGERLSQSAPPGPGVYDSSGTTIAGGLAKKTVGRNGVFGSTAQRFRKGGLPLEAASNRLYSDEPGAEDRGPGPGSHNPVLGATSSASGNGGGSHRVAPARQSVVYRSSLARSNRPEGHQTLPKHLTPAPSMYVPELAERLVKPREGKGGAANFQSAAKRFDYTKSTFGGRPIEETPGPGEYGAQKPFMRSSRVVERSRVQVRTNLSNQERFREATSTGVDCGPGTYDTGSTMLKKSFNISFSQIKDSAPGRR